MNAKETKKALLHQIKLNLDSHNCTSVGFGINSGLTFKGKLITAIFTPIPDEIWLGLQAWVNDTMRSTHGDEKTLTIKFLNAILDKLVKWEDCTILWYFCIKIKK